MELRDLAKMVVAYFTAETPKEALGVLADAVEEAGVDSSPLRTPEWKIWIYDQWCAEAATRTHFTRAEQDAYINGSADADENSENVAIYYSEKEMHDEHPKDDNDVQCEHPNAVLDEGSEEPNTYHCPDCEEAFINDDHEDADTCARCDSRLMGNLYCPDETCGFSDHQQGCPMGWVGHPEPPAREGPVRCTCDEHDDEEHNDGEEAEADDPV